jgi:16S rRNA (adenine1518-N6/adenine1519-N6)-dimethyltransferase
LDENNQFYPASTDDDLLPVVDEYDKVIETLPRRQVHLGRLRHRAVEIGIVTPEGRVWLQKRSRAKDAWPGYWDLSSTGHVDAGESYEEAACREVKEELGIEARPAFVAKVEACERTGWEFQALYALRWDGVVSHYNTREIETVRAFTLEELGRMIRGETALGALTPCVAVHLPPILRALGIDPAGIENA